jgi:hypothetical protein
MVTSTPPPIRAPLGEFFIPLKKCQMAPPPAPMPNAPPMSSKMRCGHGSRLHTAPERRRAQLRLRPSAAHAMIRTGGSLGSSRRRTWRQGWPEG